MLRVAVLGAGRIGAIHARNVAANPRCRLIAIADTAIEAAQGLAHTLGAEASENPRITLARDDIDAVIIGTPTDTHIEFTLASVRDGKAVLCEKPIDLDLKRANEAAAEIERLEGRVMIGFNRRFDPSIAALKQLLEAGEIGDLRQIFITSRDPKPPPPTYKNSGGVFRDMTIHDFDMARFLLTEEPVEVVAMGDALVDAGTPEGYDTTMVIMRTASGRQCHINNCRQAVYGYDQRLEVVGSEGMLMNENMRPTTVRRWTAERTDARDPLLHFFLERYADAFRLELDAFVEAVLTQSWMPVTARDGCQALRLADAAMESAESGRAIKL